MIKWWEANQHLIHADSEGVDVSCDRVCLEPVQAHVQCGSDYEPRLSRTHRTAFSRFGESKVNSFTRGGLLLLW